MTLFQGFITLQRNVTQCQGSYGLVVGVYNTINGVYSSMGGVIWLTSKGI